MPEIAELLQDNGFEFEVNKWGSCQYSGALAMFKAYFKLRETYARHSVAPYEENERINISEKLKKSILEYLEEEYDIKISFSGIRTDEEAFDMYFKILANKLNWNFNLYDYKETEKLDERWKKTIWGIRRAQSGDDLFFVGRNASSDLWNTAPHIAQSYFVGLEMENVNRTTGLEIGPVGNISVQSTNVGTGLCCALLMDYGIVKNEKSFKGFDT
jgi:hypothetical protein